MLMLMLMPSNHKNNKVWHDNPPLDQNVAQLLSHDGWYDVTMYTCMYHVLLPIVWWSINYSKSTY